jgi:caa(3)-type oxidase subunit IV
MRGARLGGRHTILAGDAEAAAPPRRSLDRPPRLAGTDARHGLRPLGAGNIAVALTVGVAKAAIVVLVFMELARGHPLKLIFAGAGLFWLIILFGLTFTDYATRAGFPPSQ